MSEAEKSADQAGIITVAMASRLLMVSTERVRQLMKLGYIPKLGKDQVNLVSAVQGYIKFLKDDERKSSATAARSRVQDARAAEIEMRMAERRRDLVDRGEAEAAMDLVVGKVNEELAGFPARVTRDVALRQKVEMELHGSLRRISEALDASRRGLETGSFDAVAVSEDDA